MKPTEAFKSALAKAGSDFAAREYGLTSSGLSYGWFDSTFVQGLTNAQKNKLIAAMQGFSGTAYEIVIYIPRTAERNLRLSESRWIRP